VTEEELKARNQNLSETSSNISGTTQGPFMVRDGRLDIIKEHSDHDESDIDEETHRANILRKSDYEVRETNSKENTITHAVSRKAKATNKPATNIIPASAFKKVNQTY
jgi:hypothetical protein